MSTKSKTVVGRIIPNTPEARVTLDYRGRSIAVHSLTESEIRLIIGAQNSVNLPFFTLMLGLVAGFGTSLLTSHANMSDRLFTFFAGLALVCAVLAMYFGIKAVAD